MLLTLLSGCANVNPAAICDGTIKSRNDLADALIVDGGPASLIAGATLIAQLDDGCATRVLIP